MTEKATIIDGIPELGISVKNDDSWVSSRTLANYFEKNHKEVLRDIENSIKNLTAQFCAANFIKKSYKSR